MKGRVLALGLLLALFAAFLTRGAGPGPAPPPPRERVPSTPAPTGRPAEAPAFEPARDPFRYEESVAALLRTAPQPVPEPEASVAPTPAPLRLLGFVRRGDGLLAALSLYGVVVTAEAGESVEGYRVLAVDEDAGVRLRGPDGAEVVLALPSE